MRNASAQIGRHKLASYGDLLVADLKDLDQGGADHSVRLIVLPGEFAE